MTGRSRNDLRVEIEELFADMWQVPRFTGVRQGFRPHCDCFRTDDPPALHVVVALPGVDPESVRVAAVGRTLIIAGRRERRSVPGARFRQMEIEYGDFERRIELGEDVDPTRTEASYDRGMLRIVLPLEESA